MTYVQLAYLVNDGIVFSITILNANCEMLWKLNLHILIACQMVNYLRYFNLVYSILAMLHRGYLLVLIGYGFLVHEWSQKTIFSRVAQPRLEICFSMITSESKIRILPKTNKFSSYFMLKMNLNTLHNIGLN